MYPITTILCSLFICLLTLCLAYCFAAVVSALLSTSRRFIPPLPPVLWMLFTGVLTGAILSSLAPIEIKTCILSLSTPVISFVLPAVGLEMGAHLTPRTLAPLRIALVKFLMCFIPIVFVGMTLLGRCVYALLFYMNPPTNIHINSNSINININSNSINNNINNNNDNNSNTMTMLPLWSYAALFASIAIERSSVACLATIRSTQSTGVYTLFVLSVAAVQDVLALLLFVLCASLLHATGAIWRGLQELAETLFTTTMASVFVVAAARVLRVVLLWHESHNYSSRGNTTNINININTGTGTTGVSGTGTTNINSTINNNNNNNSNNNNNTIVNNTGKGVSILLRLSLLCLLCLLLAAWSWFTSSEVLLAAIMAGSLIHAEIPFKQLEAATQEFRTYYNVILFTFMGLRVTLKTNTNLHTNTNTNIPQTITNSTNNTMITSESTFPSFSPLGLLLAAIIMFIGRVLLLLLGSYCGMTAVGDLESYKRNNNNNNININSSTSVNINNTNNPNSDNSSKLISINASRRSSHNAFVSSPTLATNTTNPNNTNTNNNNNNNNNNNTTGSPISSVPLLTTTTTIGGGGEITTPPVSVLHVGSAMAHQRIRLFIGLSFVTQLAVALMLVRRAVQMFGPTETTLVRSNSINTITNTNTNTITAAEGAVLPLAQAYAGSIILSMMFGPLCFSWVLHKIGEAGAAGRM